MAKIKKDKTTIYKALHRKFSFHNRTQTFILIYFWWFGLWFLTPLSTIFQSWRSVLLVEEIGVPKENHRLIPSHWQTSLHKYCIEYASSWTVVIGTDYTGSCNSNYNAIVTRTVPIFFWRLNTYRDQVKNALQ